MQETEHSYDLKAVVSHIGTEAASGHYVTCVDTFAGWSIFDDSNVRYVSEADVLKQQGYILFYQKKDNSALTLTQVFHILVLEEYDVWLMQENANICGSQGSQPDAINTEVLYTLYSSIEYHFTAGEQEPSWPRKEIKQQGLCFCSTGT